jgi:hypothetical protein
MALIKRKTRRKLTKQLAKLVKKHGADGALALVTGIVSNLATDRPKKAAKKSKLEPRTRTIVIRKRPQARESR